MFKRSIPKLGRVALVAAAVLLSAVSCGTDSTPGLQTLTTNTSAGQTEQMSSSATDTSADAGTADPGTTQQSAPADAAPAAWQSATFTSVDGTTKSLQDYLGKPVYVEFFATWCPTCLYQLREVSTAAATDPDAVFLALSVETDVKLADVAKYQANSSLDKIEFGLISPEMLAALREGLGNTVINPPATPHVLIDSAGISSELFSGESTSAEILESLKSVG